MRRFRNAHASAADPLLTRPRVAEFIDRDPGRVTRYFQADLMPPPDEELEGGAPAWRRSTIRSWWLQRGGQLPPVPANDRYHGQWTDTDLQPELLEEQLIDVEVGRGRPGQLHVRVYRAMDGRGPVVILGWPKDSPYRWREEWHHLLPQVRAALVVDVEVEHPVWLVVRAEYRQYLENAKDGRLPSEVTISDVDNHSATITAEDVARLIGQPFDVYPATLYTADVITARRASGDQDTPTPTAVLDDDADLGPRVRRLRALLHHIETAAPLRSDILAFAAGVLAEDARHVNERLSHDAEFLNGCTSRFEEEPPGAGTTALHLAVFPQPRQLSPHEHHLVRTTALDPPLIESKVRLTDEEVRQTGEIERGIPRADAKDYLDGIRRVLMGHKYTNTSPIREALQVAEGIVAAVVHRADPEFARRDRLPRAEKTWSAGTPQMRAYLDQLDEVAGITELPFELQRRAHALQNDDAAADWSDRSLLFDQRSQLLALTGMEPSNLDEERARRIVRSNHTDIDFIERGEAMPTAVENALVTAYMADSPKVILEWPQAAQTNGIALLAHGRLVAPSATNIERPVFIKHADGSLQPLSLNGDTHFHGFVWGVSSTDTISPAVHAFLTDKPRRDWRTYENEADDPAFQAYEWLRTYLLKSGTGPLDVDGSPIVERYQALAD